MAKSPYEELEIPFDPFSVDNGPEKSSADMAISQDEFQQLLKAARELDPLLDLEMEFVLLCAGRLGLRGGEITHMSRDWVDYEDQWIEIPKHEPCTHGKDGGICGYCSQLATQLAEANDISVDEAEQFYWKAKTIRAARTVPYSYDDRCVSVIEEYFDEFDEVTVSNSKLSRKVNKASDMAGLNSNVTPHGLRATAAMRHVEAGIDMWALQSLMGWAYPNTARRYIMDNSKRTKHVLEDLY